MLSKDRHGKSTLVCCRSVIGEEHFLHATILLEPKSVSEKVHLEAIVARLIRLAGFSSLTWRTSSPPNLKQSSPKQRATVEVKGWIWPRLLEASKRGCFPRWHLLRNHILHQREEGQSTACCFIDITYEPSGGACDVPSWLDQAWFRPRKSCPSRS